MPGAKFYVAAFVLFGWSVNVSFALNQGNIQKHKSI